MLHTKLTHLFQAYSNVDIKSFHVDPEKQN